eukprot:gb/GECG01002164.1/.p1 GENE.gb/GECG01002164.1/~~gb/GECG01002164.1/.p1  ORF type:complete len:185 (+),score=22.98 gb/GECG01002164.1/:1-555(+)
MLIVVIRCAFFKSTVRFAPDLVVTGMMYALANGLFIHMETKPFATLRMFHFLGAIQYTEADSGQGSLTAQPGMQYDVSWYLTWMTIIILILVSVFMFYAGKHYDEMKKMDLWLELSDAVDPNHINNPIHGDNQPSAPQQASHSQGNASHQQEDNAESKQVTPVEQEHAPEEQRAEEGQAASAEA